MMQREVSDMERKSEVKPKVLWILMFHGYQGWMPTMDHFCAWQTKRAALKKIKELGDRGRMYEPFKYVIAPPVAERPSHD
jgi:hypothetical protein